ncbi:sensory neuron membrane protein 2-like [Diorhabda sublineata]|uniref:sensory neuron membrane protein 2-like n=1 Tax=Diorhabda sublineata TaxID=1163346 RepID=UPI0024E0453B|nr:sensory neuron membrane protein 2-like [Diorhabda sublineata]
MKQILHSKCCSTKVISIILAALIVLFIGVLVLSFYGISKIIEVNLHQSVELKENTDQWDRFIDLPIPISLKVYIFNVTNSDEVLNGEKPKLIEVGPYVYRENIHKDISSTNNDEDSVTYQKITTITFDPDQSGDFKESDEVIIVNPALLVLTEITSTIEQLAVAGCINKIFLPPYDTLFIKVDIKSVLFEGIPFAQASPDNGYACNIIRNLVIDKTKYMRNVQRIYNTVYTDAVDGLIFSLLGYKADAPDGIYTVNRGIHDVSQLGNIMKWNHSTHLPFWGSKQSSNNDSCQLVHGGDSTLYPPQITKDDVLSIFATDICRSVEIFYTGKGTYKGIEGLRFEPKETTFTSLLSNVEEDCFCTKQTKNAQGELSCYLDGVLDLYDCFGVPILLSFPHFLYANASYKNGVEGVTEADPEIHGIYLLIEPNTGTPLVGRKRVQFNLVIRPAEHLKEITKNIYSTILPLVWVEEGADLTDDLIDMIEDQYFKKVKLTKGVKYGLIAVSAAAVLSVGAILLRKLLRKK